jgi:hypothetical protein
MIIYFLCMVVYDWGLLRCVRWCISLLLTDMEAVTILVPWIPYTGTSSDAYDSPQSLAHPLVSSDAYTSPQSLVHPLVSFEEFKNAYNSPQSLPLAHWLVCSDVYKLPSITGPSACQLRCLYLTSITGPLACQLKCL